MKSPARQKGAQKQDTSKHLGPSTVHEVPAKLGFHMPAEWEPHHATWIGWPHNETDWPGKLATIHWVYAEIARKIAPGETLHILVNSRLHQARATSFLKAAGADLAQVRFFGFPTNRGWTRDFGPIFLKRNEPNRELAIVRFRFNAWANYRDWQKDNRIAESAVRALRCRFFQARCNGRDIVLEGGAIDVNGRGSVLTTEECLLDETKQVRNPGLGRAGTEAVLRDYLGAGNVLWLGKGIAGDDTHGHIDDICRFVAPGTVVLGREENPRDANYAALEENRERLQSLRLEDGSKVEVIALPMPAPLYFRGQRLPASYANFYISNRAVLVPTFNDPKDRIALGILAELFPQRMVVGIHAVDLVLGFGTLHCLTQQQPAL